MKKLLATLICLSMILTCMSGITLTVSAATVSGVELSGEGTETSPFIIDSAAKFKAVFGIGSTAPNTSDTWYLVTGFDQTAMTLPADYLPIAASFTAKVIGGNLVDNKIVDVTQKINLNNFTTVASNSVENQHYIKNGNNNKFQGILFHRLDGATVKNITLTGSATVNNISTYFGLVAGNATSTTLQNVHTYVDITGGSFYATGGLIGWSGSSCVVTNCSNHGDFTITQGVRRSDVGGLIGNMTSTTMSNCYNYGNISGTDNAGGLVGYTGASNTSISYCGNFGNVSATRSELGGMYGGAGGISGRLSCNISNSFNVGNVSGISYAGGLIANNDTDNVAITNCFNLGEVSGSGAKGIVAGTNTKEFNITGFYDIGNSSLEAAVGSNSGTLTVKDAYSYSETESTTANDVSKVSYETIAGLTENVDAFKDTAVWTKQQGYSFPSLKNNAIPFGTDEVPYLVFTLSDLKNVSNVPAANYKLMKDIEGMNEMLCVETPFSGVFDGNGKSITLAIDDSANETYPKYVGLFSQSTGKIKNLTTKGTVNAGYINSVLADGTASGGAAAIVGGGSTDNFLVDNCKNYATVTSTGFQTAGIVGSVLGGSGYITNSYNYGNITAGISASGIVGLTSSGLYVQKCGNYGNVTGGSSAAGICAWTYSWRWLENSFNVGTITARQKDGVAAGLYGNMVVSGNSKNIQTVFNAGALIADTTYGIAEVGSATKNTVTIRYVYNAVGADYPILNKTDEGATYTIIDCYYLADSTQADDKITETTAVATKDALITTLPSTNFGVVSDSAYKYPQVKAYPLDAAYANIDFSLVTIDNKTENDTSVNVLVCDDAKFYLPTGTELKLNVAVSDKDFYDAYVNSNKVVDGTATVTVNADATVEITDEKIAVVEPSGNAATYIFDSSEESVTVGGTTYDKYALIASKAVKAIGLKLKEFGMLLSETNDITLENYDYIVKADSGKISSEGAYGVLLYNAEDGIGGMKNGTTYYVLPYAIYVDADGEEYKAAGTSSNFTYTE